MNKTNYTVIAAIFSVFAGIHTVSAQSSDLPTLPDMSGNQAADEGCNTAAEQFIGRQYVTDKNVIVKRQSLPDEMKVTPEELKLLKPNLRVVREGDMITMEFSYDRLTINLDEYDFIVKAYCG